MLIDIHEVATRCGVSIFTIYRWRRNPAMNFPRPFQIGPRAVRFCPVELAIWIASRRVGGAV